MDNNYCCVPQCNSLGSQIPRTSFHRFPTVKDESSKRRREAWIRVLKIGKTVTHRMVACGKHFQPSDFFPTTDGRARHRTNLKKNAVPSRNLPLTSCDKRTPKRKEVENLIRLERKNRRERLKEEQNLPGPSDTNEMPGPSNADVYNLPGPSTAEVYNFAGPSNGDDYHSDILIPGLFDDVPAGPNAICPDLHQHDFQENIDEEAGKENINAAVEALLALGENKTNDVATQVKSGDLVMCRSFIKNMNEVGLNSLTGIQSFALLDLLVNFLENSKSLNPHQMPLKDQVILTLMRIKLDISFAALCVFFECSAPTCKSIFSDILKHLAALLKFSIQWLPKETVMANMPKCFKKYNNTRVVLDCTEVPVTKPDCSKCRIMTYSQYYSDHTIKIMVGISPGGLITFLSPVFGGCASDKTIFEQSGIIEYLQPHEDAVMVDKGFLIDETCANAYIQLLRPPFLRNKKQFSASEAECNTQIARARVHVERMIQRIKVFKIFEGRLPWGMLPYIQNIFTVCAGIANLGRPILADDKF